MNQCILFLVRSSQPCFRLPQTCSLPSSPYFGSWSYPVQPARNTQLACSTNGGQAPALMWDEERVESDAAGGWRWWTSGTSVAGTKQLGAVLGSSGAVGWQGLLPSFARSVSPVSFSVLGLLCSWCVQAISACGVPQGVSRPRSRAGGGHVWPREPKSVNM